MEEINTKQFFDDAWQHHGYAKDIRGVKRAEHNLRKDGWEVLGVLHSCGWKIMIRKKET